MALAPQNLEAGVVVVVAAAAREQRIGLLRRAMWVGVVLKQSLEVEALAAAAAEGPQPQVLVVAVV